MLTVVAAHRAELEGLVAALENDTLQVLCCGEGANRCFDAVSRRLASLPSPENPAAQTWINFGVAGTAAAPPGTLLLAERVIDAAGDAGMDLVCPPGIGLQCTTVLSVDGPREDYLPDRTFDMEAAGFLRALAGRGCRVAVLKLVCDGPDQPLSVLNLGSIRRLLRTHNQAIVDACTRIYELPGWFGMQTDAP